MGHYEDAFFEIYDAVQEKGLKENFDKQLNKMSTQDKHRYKTIKERWEYAYQKVTGSQL